MANVDGYNVSGTAIVEKLPGNPVPCAIARTLVESCDGKVPVGLLNPKSEPVVIASNVCVATIESVELPPDEVIANVPAKPANLKQKEEFRRGIVENSDPELSQKQKEAFFALLTRYADVFASSSSDLGRTSELHHQINTGDTFPIRQAVRRIPPECRNEVQKLLDSMLESKVVQLSKSPWASPIVLVRKKDSRFRF